MFDQLARTMGVPLAKPAAPRRRMPEPDLRPIAYVRIAPFRTKPPIGDTTCAVRPAPAGVGLTPVTTTAGG